MLFRSVKRHDGITLIGAFAAYRELESGELVALPIAHPLFDSAKARLLVKVGRPLGVAADTLLNCLLRDMTMFAGAATRRSATGKPPRATKAKRRR